MIAPARPKGPTSHHPRPVSSAGCALLFVWGALCVVSSYEVGATTRRSRSGARNARLPCAVAHVTADPAPRSPCASSCCAASARSLVRCVLLLSFLSQTSSSPSCRALRLGARFHVALLIGTLVGTILRGTILGTIRDLGAPRQANCRACGRCACQRRTGPRRACQRRSGQRCCAALGKPSGGACHVSAARLDPSVRGPCARSHARAVQRAGCCVWPRVRDDAPGDMQRAASA